MKADILTDPVIFYDEKNNFINAQLTKMNLYEIRKAQHLSKTDIVNLTGLSMGCISNIEGATGNPNLNSVIKYLNILGWEMCFKKK